jgi:hypothetical protein
MRAASLGELEWVEVSKIISRYFRNLAQLCLASAKAVNQSILPTMYSMMDEPFRAVCSEMSRRNITYLHSSKFDDRTKKRPLNSADNSLFCSNRAAISSKSLNFLTPVL